MAPTSFYPAADRGRQLIMEYKNIGEIFEVNARIHEKFRNFVGSITPEQASRKVDGEKWSIAEIVEHVSLVSEGMLRICVKLLAKAEEEGLKSEGRVFFSPAFASKSDEVARLKLDAPESVHPKVGSDIEVSLSKMDENSRLLAELRTAFDTFDSAQHKFPHPFFGDLSAAEWLALAGGHEARHMRQIKKLVEKM